MGKPEIVLADSGYFSETNVEACAAAKIAPLIAPGRKRHSAGGSASPNHRRRPRSRRRSQRWCIDWQRRQAGLPTPCASRPPKPVFGIIKSAMGFRQCHLRGLANMKGEWSLVTLVWNIKRLFALQYA